MKKHILIPVLSLIVAFASSTPALAELRIGTVDMKKIFESYWKTKEAESKMSESRGTVKRDLEERNEKLKQLAQRIEKLKEEMNKPELSKTGAQAKAKELEAKFNEFNGMRYELQQFQMEKEKALGEQTLRIRNDLVKEIQKLVSDYVATGGYDLVFDVSGYSINNVPVVMYARDAYDFSKPIIDKLNADRPKSSGTETPAPVDPKPKK